MTREVRKLHGRFFRPYFAFIMLSVSAPQVVSNCPAAGQFLTRAGSRAEPDFFTVRDAVRYFVFVLEAQRFKLDAQWNIYIKSLSN